MSVIRRHIDKVHSCFNSSKHCLNSFETQLRHLIYLHDELKRENAELKKLLENLCTSLQRAGVGCGIIEPSSSGRDAGRSVVDAGAGEACLK